MTTPLNRSFMVDTTLGLHSSTHRNYKFWHDRKLQGWLQYSLLTLLYIPTIYTLQDSSTRVFDKYSTVLHPYPLSSLKPSISVFLGSSLPYFTVKTKKPLYEFTLTTTTTTKIHHQHSPRNSQILKPTSTRLAISVRLSTHTLPSIRFWYYTIPQSEYQSQPFRHPRLNLSSHFSAIKLWQPSLQQHDLHPLRGSPTTSKEVVASICKASL